MTQYLQAGAIPFEAEQILAKAPKAPLYERLQYVRTQLYARITAAGPGNPVDVPPARVALFLSGKVDASPYEITASEVLLARWAGIPARIGYGYYDDSQKPKDGSYEIRPSDGAMWLEAYFQGYGWTPILGKPPKATSSLDNATKKTQAHILPSGELTAQLYIPVRQPGLQLLYALVQYWLARLAPVFGVVLFFWLVLPVLLKSVRRVRRRRWAWRRGPRARIAVAYAEVRDKAIDFNRGHPTDTPLEFLDAVAEDEQHRQLAWLVTRGLWGDLARDLTDQDAESAERLAAGLVKRMTGGQPFLMRAVAASSRVSLRDPWSKELPNGYRRLRLPRFTLSRISSVLSRGSAVVLVATALLTSGCAQQPDLQSTRGAAPLLTVPANVGYTRLHRNSVADAAFDRYRADALISSLALYSVKDDGVTVATLQVSSFKPGLRSRNAAVRTGVLTTLPGVAKVVRLAGERFYSVTTSQVRLLVWFSPDQQRYELLAASQQMAEPEQFFARLVAGQQGKTLSPADLHRGQPPLDGRRGTP
jgi:hypothetical protein